MKATQRLTVFFISISEGVRIDPQGIISGRIRPYLYFFLCILFFPPLPCILFFFFLPPLPLVFLFQVWEKKCTFFSYFYSLPVFNIITDLMCTWLSQIIT